jgi:hypothetical protein
MIFIKSSNLHFWAVKRINLFNHTCEVFIDLKNKPRRKTATSTFPIQYWILPIPYSIFDIFLIGFLLIKNFDFNTSTVVQCRRFKFTFFSVIPTGLFLVVNINPAGETLTLQMRSVYRLNFDFRFNFNFYTYGVISTVKRNPAGKTSTSTFPIQYWILDIPCSIFDIFLLGFVD